MARTFAALGAAVQPSQSRPETAAPVCWVDPENWQAFSLFTECHDQSGDFWLTWLELAGIPKSKRRAVYLDMQQVHEGYATAQLEKRKKQVK